MRNAKKRKTAKKGKKRNGPVLLVVLVLIAVVGVETVRVFGQIAQARAQEAALSTQVEQKEQENAALRSDISRADDPEFIKELARQRLGMAEQGERIFYDVNH